MGVVGTLSNRSVKEQLSALAECLEAAGADDLSHRAKTRYRRHRPGVLLAATIRVLAASDTALAPRMIRAAMEELLGERVSYGSLKHILAANLLGNSQAPRLERIPDHLYRLVVDDKSEVAIKHRE